MQAVDIVAAAEQVARSVGLNRLNDPKSSKITAHEVSRFRVPNAGKVLAAVVAAEPFGTSSDVLEFRLQMRGAHQRLSDLKQFGLVYGTGETRESIYGGTVEVYRAKASVVHLIKGTEQGELL